MFGRSRGVNFALGLGNSGSQQPFTSLALISGRPFVLQALAPILRTRDDIFKW